MRSGAGFVMTVSIQVAEREQTFGAAGTVGPRESKCDAEKRSVRELTVVEEDADTARRKEIDEDKYGCKVCGQRELGRARRRRRLLVLFLVSVLIVDLTDHSLVRLLLSKGPFLLFLHASALKRRCLGQDWSGPSSAHQCKKTAWE